MNIRTSFVCGLCATSILRKRTEALQNPSTPRRETHYGIGHGFLMNFQLGSSELLSWVWGWWQWSRWLLSLGYISKEGLMHNLPYFSRQLEIECKWEFALYFTFKPKQVYKLTTKKTMLEEPFYMGIRMPIESWHYTKINIWNSDMKVTNFAVFKHGYPLFTQSYFSYISIMTCLSRWESVIHMLVHIHQRCFLYKMMIIV